MCGICLLLTSKISSPDFTPIQKRGPDYFHQVEFAFKQAYTFSRQAILSAAVLSLQRETSDDVVKMPVEVGNGSILMWNGEIFLGGFNESSSDDLVPSSSDTMFVAKTLLFIEEECFASSSSSSSSSFNSKKTRFLSKVSCFFRNIGGPFSFVYFAGTFTTDENQIKKPFFIFGRDVWGRRSLMVGKNATSFMVSSSVLAFANSTNAHAAFKKRTDAAFLDSLPKENLFVHDTIPDSELQIPKNNKSSLEIISPSEGMIYEEIKPDGIYEIVASTTGFENEDGNNSNVAQSMLFECVLVAKYEDVIPDCLASAKSCPIRLHPLSDRARFQNHLSFLSMSSRQEHSNDKKNHQDCIHDSFLSQVMNKTCESLLSIRERMHDETAIGQLLQETILNITLWIVEKTHWGPDCFKVELVETMKSRFAPFITKNYVTTSRESPVDVSSFTASFVYLTFLAVAVHRRTASWNTHSPPNSENRNLRSLLILFSGGIDCVVLAKLAAILTDPKDMALDLINVSFGKDSEIHCLSSVDRISCLDSVKEILKVDVAKEKDNSLSQHSRKTRLLLADITGEEIIQHSAEIAIALLPKNTVMDSCIGAALYFGARGEGRLADVDEIMNQVTTSVEEKIEKFVPRIIFEKSRTNRHDDDDDDQDDDALTEELSNDNCNISRFLPLLKCLIRHYVDRGVEEMSICLLGKEFTSPELVATNEKFGYKTLRAQAEAAATLGLIRIRGETYQTTTMLPQVRQRIDDAQNNQQQQQNSKQCSLSGRNYYLSIVNSECLKFAQFMRQERLKLAGLSHVSDGNAKSALSQARVIIAGMGADESLGGYHRYCHKQHPAKQEQQQQQQQEQQHERLQTEMQRDFDRLWERNLGRDDRIMSSFGKEARFPFLDEAVLFSLSGIVSWIESRSSQSANDASTSASLEVSNLFKDKNLLRFGAENILGIKKEIAYKPKKAIQFGTKIANRKNKGEQICL